MSTNSIRAWITSKHQQPARGSHLTTICSNFKHHQSMQASFTPIINTQQRQQSTQIIMTTHFISILSSIRQQHHEQQFSTQHAVSPRINIGADISVNSFQISKR